MLRPSRLHSPPRRHLAAARCSRRWKCQWGGGEGAALYCFLAAAFLGKPAREACPPPTWAPSAGSRRSCPPAGPGGWMGGGGRCEPAGVPAAACAGSAFRSGELKAAAAAATERGLGSICPAEGLSVLCFPRSGRCAPVCGSCPRGILGGFVVTNQA